MLTTIARFSPFQQINWMFAGLLLLAVVLVGCGSGGTVPGEVPASALRPLTAEFLSRQAIAYSPYRSNNRTTEVVTSANIKQDLDLLIAANIKLIRLFGSGDTDSKLVLQAISTYNLDMKVMLGIWMGPKVNPDTANQQEIARGVALANTYPNIIDAVSVGNETMVNWNTWAPVAANDMVGYIRSVRSQVSQPVTTDDNWAFFANDTGSYQTMDILHEIDFVSMHTYAQTDTLFGNKWNWRQESVAASSRATAMMDAALVATKGDFWAVRNYMSNHGFAAMPIIIGETGWKAEASNGETQRAHPVNQKMYLDRLKAWKQTSALATGPMNIVYFEAFDEPWKGSDDKWGLFNVSRQARYALKQAFPALVGDGTAYVATDAVYYIPPVISPAVTANRYTVYAETVTPAEARPSSVLAWNGWNTPATAYSGDVLISPAEGTASREITPAPALWGWGMALASTTNTLENMSLFSAGHLNLQIKTTYAGKLEIGFMTGDVLGGTGSDVYLAISPGQYGYMNDGAWHAVSIPISSIMAQAAPAFGQPPTVTLDMTKVGTQFVIADRYAVTGNAAGSVIKIYVDDIHWSRL